MAPVFVAPITPSVAGDTRQSVFSGKLPDADREGATSAGQRKLESPVRLNIYEADASAAVAQMKASLNTFSVKGPPAPLPTPLVADVRKQTRKTEILRPARLLSA